MQNLETRPRVNVVMLGGRRAGKSTLLGHLLVAHGVVDSRVAKEFEKESCGDGKWAWIVDTLKAEREKRRGTIVYKQWRAPVGGFEMVLNDTPGDVKYMKSTIRVSQGADTAIVTISAAIGEFEEDISHKGQLRDILTMSYSLGVKTIILAITKMDIRQIAFSKDRFTGISKTVTDYALKVGFAGSSIRCIPLSGWTGDGLVTPSARMPWYEGPPLIEILKENVTPHRLELRALRIPILEVYKRGNKGVVVGRVESGTVSVGDRVVNGRWGRGKKITVESMETRHTPIGRAVAGVTVGIGFTMPEHDGVASTWRKGDVLGSAGDNPPTPCTSFDAQILVLRVPGHRGLAPSYTPIVHTHTHALPCTITSLKALYDRTTSTASSRQPTSLQPSQTALITMKPQSPLCVEPFHENPSLGRIIIRDSNVILAVGVVRNVHY